MLTRDVARQIRRLQLRTRRAVQDLLGGANRSVFKGAGLAFEEVREYQPGDDVRAIDWNVSARMGHPFIKRFVEERELTLQLLVDVSGSQAFGTQARSKRETALDAAALLTLCALRNHDKVGLILFSDRVEKYLPPRQGSRHALRVLREVLVCEPRHVGTKIESALEFLHRVQHRRAIVVLLSDFRSAGYEKALGRAGRRHDVIAGALVDPRELELPDAGLIEMQDAETGERLIVDTSDDAFRRAYAETGRARLEACKRQARSANVDWLELPTDGSCLQRLEQFFRSRQRTR